VPYFRDRRDAGRQLAARLAPLRAERPVVVGLPRGGVPVAFEVARALGAPLDVIIVRKLGVPAQPELGMGAIGEGGTSVLNRRVLDAAHVTDRELATVEARERTELERRARRFRGDRPRLSLAGKTVIVVDDGLATGGTARVAIQAARAGGATRVVLAVPVASPDSVRVVAEAADDVIALHTPADLRSIGEWYGDFTQTPDDEVVALLRASGPAPARAARDDEVTIDGTGVQLMARLTVPEGAPAVVLFAHGTGSSRTSPRNLAVARVLHDAGLGTLLFDLLTHAEATERGNVFDVGLLARRLRSATDWLRTQPGGSGPVGYFGASTGAGAALWAAADPTADVGAVVSRGGRPDLAGPRLAAVRAPTLLIVGGSDPVVLERNRDAARLLTCEHRLEVVPGASHLFEEPGTLEQVARLATDWFLAHLAVPPRDARSL
jgi:predicted phosphoribosyltransferase/dienelactone hydrolase